MSSRPESPSFASPTNSATLLVDAAHIEDYFPASLAKALESAALSRARGQNLGDGPRWLASVAALAGLGPREVRLDQPAPMFGEALPDPAVVQALQALSPWRKGPFDVLGVHLDTEWRCDMKWMRLQRAVNLSGKRVLDVGCGNGYYLLRALGAGAQAAIGIDPTWLYVAQFAALKALALGKGQQSNPFPAWVLPLGIEHVPFAHIDADVVFSMGVIYHRKSPIEHLEQLKAMLAPGGALLLESLVVPGDERTVLVPASRYAQMRNVWMIPSVDALVSWLSRIGFTNVEVVDVSTTTTEEQRPTPFMDSLSLEHFLHPDDPELTVEGYPRPRRAMLLARR